MDRPNFPHDNPTICVSKLFNIIQAYRADVAIMRGRHETYKIDSDLINAAGALTEELKRLKHTEDARTI